MSIGKPTWEDWGAAETALSEDPNAATGLPPKLDWLARAARAAMVGDVEAARALWSSPDAPEARWVLEASLTPAADLDPSRFRAKAKRAGVANEPVPLLDLVRLVAVAVRGVEWTSVPSPLKRLATPDRPVTAAALPGLHRSAGLPDIDATKSHVQRSLWFAASATVAAMRAMGMPDPLLLFRALEPYAPLIREKHWPDGDAYLVEGEDLRASSGPGGRHSLDDFLAAPIDAPWSWSVAREAEARTKDIDSDATRDALAGLLLALDALLRAGRGQSALPVALAARAIAARRGPVVLHRQLDALVVRLDVLTGAAETESLERVWTASQGLSADERGALARELMDRPAREGKYWRGLDDVTLRALTAGYGAEMEPRELARFMRDLLPPHLHQRALAAQTGTRRAEIEAWLEVLEGRLASAVAKAVELIDVGAHGKAVAVAMHANAATGAKRQELRNLGPANRRFVSRAREAGIALPSAFVFAALNALRSVRADELVAELVADALAADFEVDRDGLDMRLIIALEHQGADAAHEEFKRIGRWLRTAPKALATEAALAAAAGLFQVEDKARTGSVPAPERRLAWRTGFTAFVDGQGEDAAANAAAALVRRSPSNADSLLDWLDDCSSLQGTSARWHEVEQAVPDEPLESEFEGAPPPGFNPFL